MCPTPDCPLRTPTPVASDQYPMARLAPADLRWDVQAGSRDRHPARRRRSRPHRRWGARPPLRCGIDPTPASCRHRRHGPRRTPAMSARARLRLPRRPRPWRPLDRRPFDRRPFDRRPLERHMMYQRRVHRPRTHRPRIDGSPVCRPPCPGEIVRRARWIRSSSNRSGRLRARPPALSTPMTTRPFWRPRWVAGVVAGSRRRKASAPRPRTPTAADALGVRIRPDSADQGPRGRARLNCRCPSLASLT